jgi:phosphate transport system substrate-binding protein
MTGKMILAATVMAGTALVSTVTLARTEIQNKGSDTLVNVAQAWAEAYQKVDPEVAVAVSGGGSGTGIAALINGTVDIANASRKMKDKEIQLAEQHGHHPVEHIVGYDALAVFINSANPATQMTIPQLREIFGRGGKATKWTDVGLEVPGCQGQKIVVVSRQNNSGTYVYFKEAVLGEGGKYRQGTLDMHGSKDVVDLVEKTPCAIGYSGLAYATDRVKMACISKADEPCVMPSEKTASDHSYPIARPLFMYTSGEPQGEVKKYLDWVLSDAGQCIIKKKGYAPVRDVSCK